MQELVAALRENEYRSMVMSLNELYDMLNDDAGCEEFGCNDGHDMSFTDHMSGYLAVTRDIEHVFTFDLEHFRTLGFTVVPGGTGA